METLPPLDDFAEGLREIGLQDEDVARERLALVMVPVVTYATLGYANDNDTIMIEAWQRGATSGV